MAEVGPHITALLRAWRGGDETALGKLVPVVYRELHCAASRCLRRERDGHSLQTTALINELYLRLNALQDIDWHDRAHFLAVCARQMRRVLIDQARARNADKRGAGAKPVSLDDAIVVTPGSCTDVLAVDEALNALARVDERKSRVVELRFFGGLSVDETAEVLQVSPETITRDWRLARAWLARELSRENVDGG